MRPETVSMRVLRHFAAVLLVCLAQTAWAQSFIPVPELKSHVTDSAGMLTPAQQQALESVLQDYATRSGSQIAIVLVKTTAPEAIEQYSIRVADAWKLGRKGIDDGVILVVAKDNPPALRRLRIESGRGVQGVLTDAQAKRILQDVIAPHFRQNDFYGGLAAGVSAITSLLDQEKLPTPQTTPNGATEEDEASWLPILFFVFIFFVMISRARKNGANRRFNRNGWGDAAGVILGSHIGRGGFGDFGGGGGGFDSGSSDSGFSGGGGGFDGGGASGDW